MPLHRRLAISLISVFPTVAAPLDPMVIPFALLTPAQKQPRGAVASSAEDYRMVQKTASPVPWSMANRYCSHNLLPQTPRAPIAAVGNTASGGMEKTATARSINAPENTPALSAATRRTMLSPAPLSSDFLIIVTPFIADAWEHELLSYNLLDTFSDVPYSICHGFDLGIHSIPPHTYIPDNHSSAIQHPHEVKAYINTELSHGRYTGPFSPSRLEALIGPFRTSPLGVVPKPTPGEFRLVQDFSYPRNDALRPSLNSEIDTSTLSCDWGTFQDISAIVIDAPPNTQAATLDVDAAFRRCPIRPSQQPNFVINFEGLCYIDHVAPFGTSSAGFAFGRVADAMMAIMRSRNIGPAKNWVDDFVFFRSPVAPELSTSPQPSAACTYPYDLDTIESITQPLGWPWKHSKTKPFNSTFTYLGFLWDLTAKCVQIPDKKKVKYLNRLTPWVEGTKFSRKEAESILGTLVHCALAIPDGRSRLPSLSRFAASFNGSCSNFTRKSPPSTVLNDISWWRLHLQEGFCGSALSRPPPPSPIGFWVDASTDWGIGIVFDGHWEAIKFREGWKSSGRNIGWAEFIAIELGLLRAIVQGHRDKHFIVHSDNQGVIQAIQGGKSRSPEQNLVLRRILHLLTTHSIWISPSYIPSSSNLADEPSRGLPAINLPHFSTPLSLPSHLSPFLTTQHADLD
jgi:hypothetical protein